MSLTSKSLPRSQYLDTVLRLLQEDAPYERYQDLSNQAQAEGVSRADRQDLALAIERALKIRESIERHRRRERELTVLYETAGDLSSLRDVDKVLTAIVKRGRQILSTDVAYLMLIDPERGDAYMRTSVGTASRLFNDIRLKLGVGLGGLVAQMGQPCWTSNYTDDDRLAHAIDDIVAEEQLVAILGVPLQVGRRVLGVLFAADREMRSFLPEEVALFSALGDHAAIALDNAALITETQSALSRLTAANAVIEAHSAAVERAAEAHERLTKLVVSGGNTTDVIGVLARVLERAVLLLDRQARVLAASGIEPGNPWAADICEAGINSETAARLAEAAEHAWQEKRTLGPYSMAESRYWITPIAAGVEMYGALCVFGDVLEEVDLRTIERGALVVALVLLNQRAVAVAEQKVRGELLADLFSQPAREAEPLSRRAALLGVDLNQSQVVLVMEAEHVGDRHRLLEGAAKISGQRRDLSGEYRGRIVMLCTMGAKSARDIAHEVRTELQRSGSGTVTLGVAEVADGLESLTTSFELANQCLQLLINLGRSGDAATPDDMGIYAFLLAGARRSEVESFVSQKLAPLEEYDATKNARLIETIETFFECEGRAARAADALFVHVNTLYQRLERVDRLVGPAWRCGDGALQMRVALNVRKLLQGAR